jgi:hypothetical protein
VNDDAKRRLDRMKKAAGEKLPGAKGPPRKGVPKAPAKAVVTHACGHRVGLAHLESQDCTGCVGARRRAHNRERYDGMGLPRGEKFKLPAGTAITMGYVPLGGGVWTGAVLVLGGPALTAEDANAEVLVRKLGQMAREWLKAREGGGA